MCSATYPIFIRAIAIAALVLPIVGFVDASSAPRRPLKRIAQPSIHALEIVPRRLSLQQRSPSSLHQRSISPDSLELQHSDSLRLTLSVFEQSYHFHLSPNPHLLHPSARINYYRNGPDGQPVLDRTEPLVRGDVKAYWGDVIHPDVSYDRLREDIVGGVMNSQTLRLGWARIMVHYQGDIDAGIPPIFEGAFSVNGDVHHIMTKENYLRTKLALDPHPVSSDHHSALVIFRDSDIMKHGEEDTLHRSSISPSSWQDSVGDSLMPDRAASRCSHDDLRWNTDPWMNPALRKQSSPTWIEKLVYPEDATLSTSNTTLLFKRDDVAGGTMTTNFADKIGQKAGCPISQQIVYMGVATDCKYVQQYGSQQNATSAILNDWNMVSALYKSTFNVSLGIVQLEIHDPTCPQPPDQSRPWNVDCGQVTLNDRLSLFSQWRGNKGADGTGLWHLMSGCPTGSEIGVAWLGTLCQVTANGSPGNIVSGTAVTTAGRAEWQVVAHEIGHNFGAIHDCTSGCNNTSPCCPLTTTQCDANSQFVMSPTSSPEEVTFSACSLGNICSMMQGKINNTCLQPPDPNKQTFSLQMCGNGIVEAGEDCDPGKGTNSTCCNSATCKFTSGSVCDPLSSTCCTQQCQFSPSTQVCRPSQDSRCDIEEKCTGRSSTCPWDVTKPNGQSCGSNGLACASGKCTSVAQQCQTIGASMNLKDACPNKGDTSCQVSCQDPNQPGQCVVLQAQLIDGSPCGFGGSCIGGRCKPGSLLTTAKSWYLQNLQISIPVTVVVGILVLFILYGLLRCAARCCCGDRDRETSSEPALRSAPAQRLGSFIVPPQSFAPPPSFAPQSQFPPEQVWVPPPAVSARSGQASYNSVQSRSDIPPALRAGSSQPAQSPYNGNRYPQRPYASSRQGSRSVPRTEWVDPTAWNGPAR